MFGDIFEVSVKMGRYSTECAISLDVSQTEQGNNRGCRNGGN